MRCSEGSIKVMRLYNIDARLHWTGSIYREPKCKRGVGFVTMWRNISDDGHGNSDGTGADKTSRVVMKAHEQSTAARRWVTGACDFGGPDLKRSSGARQLTAPAWPDR